MPNVFEIAEELHELEKMLVQSEGEWTDEIDAYAKANAAKLARKVDGLAAVYRRAEANRATIKAEQERLKMLDATEAKTMETMLRFVDVLMTATGDTELRGTTGGYWKRIGKGGALPLTVTTVDPAVFMFPGEGQLKEEIELVSRVPEAKPMPREWDKDAIRKQLEQVLAEWYDEWVAEHNAAPEQMPTVVLALARVPKQGEDGEPPPRMVTVLLRADEALSKDYVEVARLEQRGYTVKLRSPKIGA